MAGEKKSDSIEVRIPHSVKQAFMARCREEGQTASDAIRVFVDGKLANPASPRSTKAIGNGSGRRMARALMAVTLAGMAMVGPSTVSAAPSFDSGFLRLDRNHNGLISPDEYGNDSRRKATLPGCGKAELMLPLARESMPEVQGVRPFAVSASEFTFAAVDRNHDGQISREEFADHWLQVVRRGFARFDKNHDGVIDRSEYAAAYKPVFMGDPPDIAPFLELDSNRDGKIEWGEFIA